MIKLNHILSELLINEALPPSVAREFVSIKRNKSITKRLDSIFGKLAKMEGATTSKRGDRVYIPFATTAPVVKVDSPVENDVKNALKGSGYILKDYQNGIVTDKFGRDVKIGRVLTKLGHSDTLDKFKKDKTRTPTKKTGYILVFSKHPYDIAGMSTDRGWTSCMDIYDGSFAEYISHDVKEGTFICYLTKKTDTNLNKPSGRVLVKPYINTKKKTDVIYAPELKVYGTIPSSFLTKVGEILDTIQGDRGGKFKLKDTLYCDTETTITKYSKKIKDILSGNSKPTDVSTVEEVLNILDIKRYTVNSDLTVDVKGSVNITSMNLKVIPVQFRSVSGGFICEHNQLTTLEGAPQTVGGNFSCSYNQLTTLEGAPQTVGGIFWCSKNKLTTLKGAPQEVGGDFWCSELKLTTLEGAPQKVGGSFYCYDNQLTTLEGAPKTVGGDFYCSKNKLTTLEGAPQVVGVDFVCTKNQPPLTKSQKSWARENIKAKRFEW